MQALEAARRAGAAGNEHCLGSGLCRMECGKAAAMKQAGIVQAAHDRQECIQTGAIFRDAAGACRAEHWQAEANYMRKACLGFAARTLNAKLNTRPRAMAGQW